MTQSVRAIYYLATASDVSRDQTPTLTERPSIHPRGLLQWYAEQYDEGLVEAIEETRASWWSNPVTDQSIDELKRPSPCARYPHDCCDDEPCLYMKSRGRTACGWKRS